MAGLRDGEAFGDENMANQSVLDSTKRFLPGHSSLGAAMLAVKPEQSEVLSELSEEHIRLVSMLCVMLVSPRCCVLHTATQAAFLRRRGHGAPSPRLMGVGDNLEPRHQCGDDP